MANRRVQPPLERLRTFGDPTLRQTTRPVTDFDARIEKLAQLMFAVMEREEGVGLAAPQIGLLSRIMVWRHPEKDDERHVFVNPQIIERSEECCVETEGCLSLPGAIIEISRSQEILVEAQDTEGKPLQMKLEGMPARVVQHEVDHLDGCLILDRASPEDRRRVLSELRERSLSTTT